MTQRKMDLLAASVLAAVFGLAIGIGAAATFCVLMMVLS